jgi:hypothetical protein
MKIYFIQSPLVTYRLFLILAFVHLAHFGKSQIIEGLFIDSRQKPIPFVAVVLYQLPDSTVIEQTTSDDKGRFRFSSPQYGRFFIKAHLMGFQKYESAPIVRTENTPSVQDLPKIQLLESENQLKTLTVTVKKPLVEIQDNKLVVNIANSTLAEGGSTLDVLSSSPGVSVDNDGTIFLKGKAAVRIFIDGKPTYLSAQDLAAMLRSMPSNQLETIEIMSNPPARYDAEGNAGVINIRTKKNQNDGTNGSINLSAGQGKLPKHSAGLTLNNRAAHLNTWLNYAFAYREDWVNSRVNRQFKQTGQLFDQDLLSEYPNQIHNLRTGLDYEINKKNTVGLTLNLNGLSYKTLARNSSDFISRIGEKESNTLTETHNAILNQNGTLGLNYRGTLKKEGQTLGFDADFAQFKLTDNQNYESAFTYYLPNRPATAEILRGAIRGDIRVVAVKTDYTHPLSKTASFEMGLKSSFVTTDNDVVFRNGDGQVDKSKTNHFQYRENINAAYLTFSKTLKNLRLNAGLRAEQTLAKGYQQTNDSSFRRHYWHFFPNIVLKHSLPKKQELTYSFSRRIDRPNYQDLNPFLFFFDNYTFVGGNSFLQPQLTSLFEITYAHPKNIILTINASRTTGVITRVLSQSDVAKTIFQTNLNLNTFDNYGLALTLPLKIAKFWQTNNTLNLFHNHYYGIYLNTPFDNRLTSFALNSIQNITIGKGWTGELSLNYNAPVAYGIFRYISNGAVSIGLQKSILKQQGTIRLNVRDLFYTQRRGADILYQNMAIHVRHAMDTRFATLAFNYRFGNAKVAPARQRRTASEEERRRTEQ